MLKTNNNLFVEGNFIGVKFVTGEDVLCKVGAVTETDVTLLRPHFITAAEGGMAFMPWPTMVNYEEVGKHAVTIERSKILTPYPLRKDFLETLLELLDEKPVILVPDKKILTR